MRRILPSAAALCLLLCPFAARSQTVTPLYTVEGHIDGAGANGPLVQVGGKLYGTTSAGAAHGCGEVFGEEPATGRKSTVYAFTCQGDGGAPITGLAFVGGMLFGTTSANGAAGYGTVFQIDRTTGTETTLYSFTATDGRSSAPLLGYNGLLYGTLSYDGPKHNGPGSIITINPTTGAEAIVHTFTGAQSGGNDGAYPNGLTRVRDTLYGTTQIGGSLNEGAIYQLDAITGVVKTLYSFGGNSRDGMSPEGPMIVHGHILYGTTNFFNRHNYAEGTVFSFRPQSGKLETLHRFTGDGDGGNPVSSLASDGHLLYGVTEQPEVLFSIDPSTHQETTLHAFSYNEGYNPGGGLIDVGGTLYGTKNIYGLTGYGAGGTLFGYGIASGQFSILHQFTGNAKSPPSRLTQVGRTLYGTTPDGGTMGFGSIFKVDIDGTDGKTLYSFTGDQDGAEPVAQLTEVSGKLYGTTRTGASQLSGSVFSYDLASHALTTIHAFADGTDGRNPTAPLLDIDGALYGTTSFGGTKEFGVVYKIDLATQEETVVHDFKTNADGKYPYAGLTAAGGLLYGVTSGGGLGCGVIYSLDPTTGAEATDYSLKPPSDGCRPTVDMVFNGSKLFGSTDTPYYGYPVVFAYDPATQTEATLHTFKGGAVPPNSPLLPVGRELYGVTLSGRTSAFGSIVKVSPESGHITTLYDFTGGADGAGPSGLIHDGNAFYGTAGPPSGTIGLGGVVFKFEP